MRILIIEDQRDQRELTALLLDRKGFSTVAVETVAEGLDRLRKEEFEVVLMDVMLPDRDGFDFLSSLAALDLPRRPALLALTALGMRDDRERLLKAGCDDVIVKPVSVPRLLAAIARHTGGGR